MKTIDTNSKLWVHLNMKKSSPFPIIIIVLAFILIPIVFWYVTFRDGSENIQGAKTEAFGLLINVKSENGTWDMYKYICKDRGECLESLTSGKALGKTSGGGGEDQFVSLRYSPDWESYEILKIFVSPGWGSIERYFSATFNQDVAGSSVERFEQGGDEYTAVFIPVKILQNTLVESLVFSDN